MKAGEHADPSVAGQVVGVNKVHAPPAHSLPRAEEVGKEQEIRGKSPVQMDKVPRQWPWRYHSNTRECLWRHESKRVGIGEKVDLMSFRSEIAQPALHVNGGRVTKVQQTKSARRRCAHSQNDR